MYIDCADIDYSCTAAIQPKCFQHTLCLAERAHDSSHGARYEPEQRRRHADALGQRALRILKHIHDLNFMPARQMRLTQRT